MSYKKQPRKRLLKYMWKLYGHDYANKCRDCCNCMRLRQQELGRDYGEPVHKCRAFCERLDPETDWDPSWDACRLFDQPFDPTKRRTGFRMMEIERLRKEAKSNKPIDGQVSLIIK